MTASGPQTSLDAIASAALDDEDARVIDRLADLYQALDPVPDGLVDRIRFGVTLDALHTEVAQLQRSAGLAGVRAEESESQTVTFTSSHLTTMVTITPTSAQRVRIDGWIAPGGGVSVELRTVDSQLHTIADADGRFVFDAVPRGLAKFVLRSPVSSAHPAVLTPSIEL